MLIILLLEFDVFLKLFYFILFIFLSNPFHKIKRGEKENNTVDLYRMSWIGHVFAWGLLEVDTTLWTNWKLFRTRSTFPYEKNNNTTR